MATKIQISEEPLGGGLLLEDKYRVWKRNYMREYMRKKGGHSPMTSLFPNATKEEYVKLYYYSQFERIKAHKGQKFVCPCGGRFSLTNKARHQQTQKHQDWESDTTSLDT